MRFRPRLYSPRSSADAAMPLITTVSGGLHWHCLPAQQRRILSAAAPDWAHLAQAPSSQQVKANPMREVYRVNTPDGDVYVKCYRRPTWVDGLKWRCRGAPSALEFQALQMAQRRQAPAPRPLAWAVAADPDAPEALLVTESLGPNIDLESLIWQEPLPENACLAAALAQTARAVAQLHCGGFIHRDLHPGNILLAVDEDQPGAFEQAWITDLQSARIYQRDGHPSANPDQPELLADLACLYAGLAVRLDRDLREGFVQHYLDAAQPLQPFSAQQVADYHRRLVAAARAHDRRVIARHDRRCLRNSRYSKRLHLPGGWRGRVFLQTRHPREDSRASRHRFTAEHWAQALADPTDCLTAKTLLKEGGLSTVVGGTLTVGAASLAVVSKHIRRRPGWRGMLRTLAEPRARRQWRLAHALIARRVPTAQPLAYLQRAGESIFIAERITGGQNLNLVLLGQEKAPVDRRGRVELAHQIGALIGQLEAMGLRHRDCKASNIMVRPQGTMWRPCLIDLDGIEMGPTRLLARPCNELIRLAASIYHLPTLCRRDYLDVLRGYLTQLERAEATDRTARHKLYRELVDEVPRRARRTNRRVIRQQTLPERTFKNILIIKPSSLGDVVRCTPIVAVLRQRYADARISWLVRPEFAGLLECIDGIDEIIPFDRKRFGTMWRNPAAAAQFVALLKRLHQARFDAVLDLQGLFRSGFLSLVTGAPTRLGFADARELAPMSYTDKIAPPGSDEHIVTGYWRFMTELGVEQPKPHFTWSIPATADTAPDGDFVVMLLGASEACKRWPVGRFAELAQMIQHRYDMPTVLLGAGAAEAALAEEMIAQSSSRVANLVNRTTLPQLVAICQRAKLVVGNDSGPLHVAAALDRPTVSLYGPTNPVVVGPYGQMDGVVQVGAEQKRQGRYSHEPAHQMTEISVAQVVEMVVKKMSEN